MKLLPKSKASQEAAKLKKAQIDEGVKIASKIDALRRTLAELEVQHEQYLLHIAAEGKESTTKIAEEIATLKNEVKSLEERKKELQKPLDSKWEEVKEKEKQVDETLTKARETHNLILQEKDRQKIFTKKAVESLNKIRVRERAIKIAFVEASEDRVIAYNERKEAYEAKEKSNKEIEETQKRLSEKERELDVAIVACENKEKRLIDREKDLVEREVALEDKYQTLERTVKRLKKHGN